MKTLTMETMRGDAVSAARTARRSPARGSARGAALRAVAASISAALIVLAFPPPHVRALAWFALVPLLLSMRGATLIGAAALGGVWGMLGAYGVTDWLPDAVSRYYQQPLWIGTTLFLAASFVMGAVEYMAFGAFYCWATRRRLPCVPLLAAAAWVAAELGRTRLLTGNPWGLLGYTQTPVDAGSSALGWHAGIGASQLIQVADIAGVYGVSFVLAAINAALAEICCVVWARSSSRRASAKDAQPGTESRRLSREDPLRILRDVALPFVVLFAVLLYGAWRVHAHATATEPVRVAIVQGNLDLGSQWREDLYGANLDLYLELTRQVAHDRPAIVFWPENAMTFFVDDEPAYRAAIATITKPADVELVAGAPRFERRDDPIYYNSAFVLDADGQVAAHYDKQQLLPFAEYFPFASVDLLRRSFARVREFSSGREVAPLPTRAGRAAITICNEAMFPHLVRERVLDGAAYLVNLSNDTWIGDAEFAEQQLGIVSMRAVEQRRYLVRASTSGPSAIVDPHGTIVARTPVLSRAVLVGDIASADTLTWYGRFGDWFAWCCIFTVVAVVIGTSLRTIVAPATRH